jgi:hypothetical protein
MLLLVKLLLAKLLLAMMLLAELLLTELLLVGLLLLQPIHAESSGWRRIHISCISIPFS